MKECGKAEQIGIAIAKGEYIGFVDSDDYVVLDFIEKLYKAAKKNEADIAICGFDRINLETKQKYSTEMIQYEGKDIDMSVNPENTISINGALWNKLYKAQILKNIKNIQNPPKVLEDMMFTMLALLKTKKITFIGESLYYYMVRPDSAMSSITKEQIELTQNAMIEVKKTYEKSENGKKLIELIDCMAFLHFGISLMFRISYDKNCNFKEELKSNKEFLDKNFSTWRKSKYLNLSYSITHGFSNIKVCIMKKIYILNLFTLFLKFYRFMIEKLKIDIKW